MIAGEPIVTSDADGDEGLEIISQKSEINSTGESKQHNMQTQLALLGSSKGEQSCHQSEILGIAHGVAKNSGNEVFSLQQQQQLIESLKLKSPEMAAILEQQQLLQRKKNEERQQAQIIQQQQQQQQQQQKYYQINVTPEELRIFQAIWSQQRHQSGFQSSEHVVNEGLRTGDYEKGAKHRNLNQTENFTNLVDLTAEESPPPALEAIKSVPPSPTEGSTHSTVCGDSGSNISFNKNDSHLDIVTGSYQTLQQMQHASNNGGFFQQQLITGNVSLPSQNGTPSMESRSKLKSFRGQKFLYF